MLSLGIIGLPNIGKSTLFNALLGRALAPVAKHPFTTIDKNTGVVAVPDKRLKRLKTIASELAKIKPSEVEVIPTSIKFIDIAGLVKGAHKGEGLGNEFLGHIREVDAIVHVLRQFNGEIPHVMEGVDPVRDFEIVQTELILKDLQGLSLRKDSPFLEKIKSGLNKGIMVKDQNLTDKAKEEIRELFLLTAKPALHVLNVAERQLSVHSGKSVISDLSLLKKIKEKVGPFLVICAQLESELSFLSEDEAKDYMIEFGIKKSSLDQVVVEGYKALNLLTFFTIAKGKKVCAWSLEKGKSVLEAASTVHSDFARGFIKAEVIPFQELSKIGSWKKGEKMGKIKMIGKEYLVQDGDVLEFRFSL